jgi:hypothetical protein
MDTEVDRISIDKLVKQFKTRRCFLDFDTNFFKTTYVSLSSTNSKQKTNEANKKHAKNSTNMNDNIRSMLHAFCGEMS